MALELNQSRQISHIPSCGGWCFRANGFTKCSRYEAMQQYFSVAIPLSHTSKQLHYFIRQKSAWRGVSLPIPFEWSTSQTPFRSNMEYILLMHGLEAMRGRREGGGEVMKESYAFKHWRILQH